MLVHIGTGKESAQHVANRLLKILVDKGHEAETAWTTCRRHVHRQDAADADQREGAEEARGAHVERRGGEGRGRRAGAPVAVLQPGAGRRDSRLRDAAAAACRCTAPTARTRRHLKQTPERIIEVAWENDLPKNTSFKVEVFLDALDRMNLLRDVAIILSEQGANVLSSSTTSHRDGMVEMRFLFQVSDINHIDIVLSKLRGIEGVFDARRMVPKAGGGKKKTRSDA